MNVLYCREETVTRISPPEVGLYVHVGIYLESAECASAAAVTAAGAAVATQIPYAGAVVSGVLSSYATDIVSKNHGWGVYVELMLPILAATGSAYFVNITSAPPVDAAATYEGYFAGMRATVSDSALAGGFTPDGWIRLAVDLNMGAHGKYIYFEVEPPPSAFTTHQLSTYATAAQLPNIKQLLLPQQVQHPPAGWWHPVSAPVNCICALDVETGKTPQVPVPAGYTQIRVDLNMGAGGEYIYASYKIGAPALSGIGVIAGSTQQLPPPAGFTVINVDLNKGAGGKYIYLCYK